MLPVIAIVGRPNVGKSTLFNKLTKTRDAIVVDLPGVTRDRKYGEATFEDQRYIVIDTGGIGFEEEDIDEPMSQQSWQAVEEADIVFFVVDGQAGLNPIDEEISNRLRRSFHKKLYLVVNKVDGLDPNVACGDFYSLNKEEIFPVAATIGRGVNKLLEQVTQDLPDELTKLAEIEEEHKGIRIVLVGRPNVGKSTLVNRFIGEERMVVFDQPGTTRDSVYVPFERHNQSYVLVDTAGVRRRAKVKETVEKFSVIKTLQAVEGSQVCLMVIDAQQPLTDQDLGLIDFILEAGKALVLVINKWDNLDDEHKQAFKANLKLRIQFLDFVRIHYISALHGSGVGKIFNSIHEAFDSAMKELKTPELTDALKAATTKYPPSIVKGRRIKLRYAHAGGKNPPIIVIHGNQTEQVKANYKRYLMKFFREKFKLVGTPIRLLFKTGENPHKDKRNTLTPRQQRKRKRLKDFHKDKR